jgi:predicted RNase H-like HicB family nuclease
MKESARYIKIVEWSDEDESFVGHCPGIIGPCCHGDDETQVYMELCSIVDEWIDLMKQEGKPLPPPTAGSHVFQKTA